MQDSLQYPQSFDNFAMNDLQKRRASVQIRFADLTLFRNLISY
jgi:hypothetical protein